jgi:hypothetical protein
MQMILPDRQVYFFRVLCMAFLFAGAACYVLFTLHWQWMWDTQVMHYISFLLDHGKAPYRDIYDINMPGAYLTERWAIDIFGGGDLGWRLYEFTLLGTMTAAMIVIAWPYDWLAGLFSGVLFSLLYGALGPFQATERDEVMTVLIFVGYALLFTAVRRDWPALMLPFGLALGIAILIKPTVFPFAIALLLFPFFVLKSRGKSPTAYIMLALAGFAIALGILLDFLLPQHAFGPFLFILRRLVPYYSSLAHPTLWVLIRRALPKTVLLYALIAVVLAATNKQRANWEIWAVRLGFLFGAVSYFVQRKGYDYHRISYLCFGLLWVGLDFTAAMKDRGWRRNLGALGMAIAVLLMVPFNAYKLHARQDTNPAAFALEQDLIRLGGGRQQGLQSLQGKVQCLDLVGGCLSALYRLGLVQSTGFTGDLQFFGPDDGNVVPYYRRIFWDDIHRHPPEVILLSNDWYQESSYSFDKLNTWPEFRDYLDSAYRLDATQGVFMLYGYPMVYRVYVLKR